MKSLLEHRPSASMVVALIALFVALAGSGYAAIKLPANSVGTKQLKKNAVQGSKIAPKAVTGSKVAPNTLTGASILESTLGTVPAALTANTAAPTGAAGGDLTGSSYPNPTIAAQAVTNAKLATGSVDSAKIVDGSVTLGDLEGVDVVTSVDFPSVPANSCFSAEWNVPGTQVGQVPLLAFVGNALPPASLIVTAIKISSPDTVRVQLCNPRITDFAGSTGVGVRVITFN